MQEVAINASEGHRAFGQLLKRVYNTNEHLIVERDGFPVAVILSYQEYKTLMRERALADFEQLGRDMGKQAEAQGLTEDQLMAQLEETKKQVYPKTYGQADSAKPK